MKAFTLTQPYATLVAEGLKRWETRSWRTHYRGPLAIHAAAGYGGVGGRLAFERIMLGLPSLPSDIISDAYGVGSSRIPMLPLGMVIAVTVVEECIPTDVAAGELDADELAMGNYAPGRFAWRLRSPVMLDHPFAAMGKLGFWNVDDDAIPVGVRSANLVPV